ncbi:MAG: hypothetical protein OCC46_08065 [Pseudodesulfovibrio sp.]
MTSSKKTKQSSPLGTMFPEIMDELANIPSPNGFCQLCEKCPQESITFDSEVVEFQYKGQTKGSSTSLHSVSEIAERMNIHPAAIPLHMSDINRPVYSIDSKLYVNLVDLKHLVEVHGVLPCIMRG